MRSKPFEIKEVIEEATDVKTFMLDRDNGAFPGQFVKVWLPHDGLEETGSEKPFSVSYLNPLGLTVKKVGPFTNVLYEKKEGDKLFISEPLGNGLTPYQFEVSNIFVIGGGTGIVSPTPLAEQIKEKTKAKIISFLGANRSEDLIFEERLKRIGNVYVSTMDGSKGKKGVITELFKDYEFPENSKALVCGPEKMIYYSVEILKKQLRDGDICVSLERLIKCGYSLCGSCNFGKYTICTDGPFFTYDQIKNVEDFGNFKRDRTGRRVPI